MDTEAEAIQSSPRFFLVSANAGLRLEGLPERRVADIEVAGKLFDAEALVVTTGQEFAGGHDTGMTLNSSLDKRL